MESRKKIRRFGMVLILALICSVSAWAVKTVIFQGHLNGRVSGYDKTDLEMFKAHPQDARFYTEIWFNEMQFPKEGILVTVTYQLHNLGISRRYLDTGITVSDPATGLHLEKIHFDPDQVRIDAQGFGIGAGNGRIELQKDRYRLMFSGKQIQADFTCQILAPSFQQGDGKIVFPESGDFVRYNFPIPWAKITGRLTYNGKTFDLSGVGSMNHDWQVLSPTRYPSEWRGFWIYADTATISIVMNSSKDLAEKWTQRLMVAEPGKILFSSHEFKYRESELLPVPGGLVPCPRKFLIEAVHGQDRLTGEIRVSQIQEKSNVLAAYPKLFQQLSKLLVAETWSYRFWVDYEFQFTQDGKTREIKGRGAGNYISSIKAQKEK